MGSHHSCLVLPACVPAGHHHPAGGGPHPLHNPEGPVCDHRQADGRGAAAGSRRRLARRGASCGQRRPRPAGPLLCQEPAVGELRRRPSAQQSAAQHSLLSVHPPFGAPVNSGLLAASALIPMLTPLWLPPCFPAMAVLPCFLPMLSSLPPAVLPHPGHHHPGRICGGQGVWAGRGGRQRRPRQDKCVLELLHALGWAGRAACASCAGPAGPPVLLRPALLCCLVSPAAEHAGPLAASTVQGPGSSSRASGGPTHGAGSQSSRACWGRAARRTRTACWMCGLSARPAAAAAAARKRGAGSRGGGDWRAAPATQRCG